MAKKSLEEKIKNVGFWAFGFIFWYLVVAFFLKSSYPIYDHPFNRIQAYETIKDVLSLTAAFLAPIAALVLFSDWREQYLQTKIEKDAQSIYDDIVIYLSLLNKLERLVQKKVLNEKEYFKALELRDSLRPVNEELNRKIIGFKAQSGYESVSGQDFYQKSKDIFRYFRHATGGVRTLLCGLEKETISERYIQRLPEFDRVLGHDIYDNLDEIAEDLSTLAIYKSQVESVIN